jgi:hypothetical protein
MGVYVIGVVKRLHFRKEFVSFGGGRRSRCSKEKFGAPLRIEQSVIE